MKQQAVLLPTEHTASKRTTYVYMLLCSSSELNRNYLQSGVTVFITVSSSGCFCVML